MRYYKQGWIEQFAIYASDGDYYFRDQLDPNCLYGFNGRFYAVNENGELASYIFSKYNVIDIIIHEMYESGMSYYDILKALAV